MSPFPGRGRILPGVLLLLFLPRPGLAAPRQEGGYETELQEAETWLRKGKRERARYLFEEILEAAGEEEGEEAPRPAERARALEGLARLDFERGRFSEALERLGRAGRLVSRPHQKLLEARIRAATGSLPKALGLVEGITRQENPKQEARVMEARFLKGLWLRETGKEKKARRTFLEAEDFGRRRALETPRAKLFFARSLIALGGRDRLYEASRLLIETTREDPLLAGAYVALGDLNYEAFRESRGLPSGESEYKRALKNCGEVEAALVGLFLSRRNNYLLDYRKTLSFLARALELNPNSVPALRAKASRMIDDRNFEGARSLLKRALSINPRDKWTLAEMAAVSHLTYREKEEKTYRERIFTVDPSFVRMETVLGEHLIALYRFEEALVPLRKANGADPEDYETMLALGRALIHTGKGAEGAAVLEKSRKARPGFVHPWRENQLFLQERIDRSYETVESGNFIFTLHPREKEVLLPYLRKTYEGAYKDLGTKYGVFPDCKVRVEAFERFGDFSVRTIGFKGFGALGACFGCLITSVSPAAPELRAQFSWKVTAWHEFSHVLHLKLSKARVPRWLTEGIAVFEELGLDASYDRRMERELHSAWVNESILPLAELNTAFRGPGILFGYYQGGLIVRHLVRDFGFQKVVELVKAYAEDKSTLQIFREVLGLEPEEFDRRFLGYVESLVGHLKLVPKVEEKTLNRLLLKVAKDPSDLDSRLLLATGYVGRGLVVDAGAQLGAIKKLDPDLGDALLLRARLAWSRKDVKETRRLLRLGFAKGGDDFDSRMLHGSILEKAGRLQDALVAYEKAVRCWPTCPLPGEGSPFLLQARVLRKLGKADESAKALETFLKLNGRDHGGQIALSEFWRKRGDRSRELEHREKARDIDPFDRKLHERLAELYRLEGRYEDAVFALRICLVTTPDKDRSSRNREGEEDRGGEEVLYRSRIRLRIAEILLAAGDRSAARREARAVLESGEDLPEEIRARARSLLGK